MRAPHVLVTRAAQQGSELAERLRALGLVPLVVPALEVVEPPSFAVLDRALADLGRFDWLLLTSANGVAALRTRWPARPPATLRVGAIGQATARALESWGVRPDLIPAQATAEAMAAALLPHAHGPAGRPARFLLVRAEEGREVLPDSLRAAGAEVTVAPAYRTVVPQGSVAQLRLLLGDGMTPIDAIPFTSSSTVRNLLALCEAAGVRLPEEALRVSIGPITSQTLREVGLPPHAEAPEATVLSLAETVLRVLAEPSAR